MVSKLEALIKKYFPTVLNILTAASIGLAAIVAGTSDVNPQILVYSGVALGAVNGAIHLINLLGTGKVSG